MVRSDIVYERGSMPRQHGWRTARSSHTTDAGTSCDSKEFQGKDPLRRLLLSKCRDRHWALLAVQLLFTFDLLSDLLFAFVLFRLDFRTLSLLVVCAVVVQTLLTWGLTLVYIHTMTAGRTGKPPLIRSALSLGPLGIVALDVLMLADSLSVVCLDDVDFGDLVDFVPTFRASRFVFAAASESLPSLLIQLHALLLQTRGGRGLAGSMLFAAGLDAWIVRVSFGLSVLCIALNTARVMHGARRADMYTLAYMSTVLDIGAGLPLHAIHTNVITAYTLTFEPEPEELDQVCRMIAHNSSLNALDLSSRNVDERQVPFLADAVRYNHRLQLLWLGRNQLGDEGVQVLAGALAERNSLTDLRLWDNHVGDPGAKALGRALTRNASLRELILVGNDIGDEGACALAEALAVNVSLFKLGLSTNMIGNRGVEALATALLSNNSLRELSLAYNRLDSDGANTICNALHTNTGLKELTLWDNDISCECEERLVQAWTMTNREGSCLCLRRKGPLAVRSRRAMQDRLAELRSGAPPPDFYGGGGDVEMGTALRDGVSVAAGGGGAMTEFFAEIGKIKVTMAQIRQNIRLIEKHHQECLTAISTEQGKSANEKLEMLMEATNRAASEVRTKLKTMDAQNKELMRSDPASSETRIRATQHGTLTRKFVDLMSEYQEVQTKYKNKYRERVERQYKIVKPEASREEIEQVLEGDAQQEIFTQQILQQPGHAAAKNALADIQERHRDIHRLEQSIAELHQLFLDMAVLVESQGELLDQIEYTVHQAVNYTAKGVEELRSANQYQKKARKKMCILVVILLVIILIITLPLVTRSVQNDS